MRLQAWLDKEGKTAKWLADTLKISKPAVSGWIHGKTYPSLPLAVQVVELTNFEVSYRDLAGMSPVSTTDADLEDL